MNIKDLFSALLATRTTKTEAGAASLPSNSSVVISSVGGQMDTSYTPPQNGWVCGSGTALSAGVSQGDMKSKCVTSSALQIAALIPVRKGETVSLIQNGNVKFFFSTLLGG